MFVGIGNDEDIVIESTAFQDPLFVFFICLYLTVCIRVHIIRYIYT